MAANKKDTPRGGKREGAGRKPLEQGEDSVTVTFRATLAQREKLRALGGGTWIRGQINRAKVKP